MWGSSSAMRIVGIVATRRKRDASTGGAARRAVSADGRPALLSGAGTSPALLGSADAVREPSAREDLDPDGDGWWDLHQGAYVIGYREKVNLPPDLTALLRPRSSLLRSGVAIHGAVWDAGYSGRGEGLLAVMNPRGYRIQRGARVAQLVFFRLSRPTGEGYAGRYQGENA